MRGSSSRLSTIDNCVGWCQTLCELVRSASKIDAILLAEVQLRSYDVFHKLLVSDCFTAFRSSIGIAQERCNEEDVFVVLRKEVRRGIGRCSENESRNESPWRGLLCSATLNLSSLCLIGWIIIKPFVPRLLCEHPRISSMIPEVMHNVENDSLEWPLHRQGRTRTPDRAPSKASIQTTTRCRFL